MRRLFMHRIHGSKMHHFLVTIIKQQSGLIQNLKYVGGLLLATTAQKGHKVSSVAHYSVLFPAVLILRLHVLQVNKWALSVTVC